MNLRQYCIVPSTPQGAPVKAGVWRVESPRTPSPAGGACTLGARCLVSSVTTDPSHVGHHTRTQGAPTLRGSFAEAVSSRGPAASKVSVAIHVSLGNHGKPLQSSTPRLKLSLPGHSLSAAKAAEAPGHSKDSGAIQAMEVTPLPTPRRSCLEESERAPRSSEKRTSSPKKPLASGGSTPADSRSQKGLAMPVRGLRTSSGGTCESRCLESGVSTDPEPCGFARPRLAVRGFPVYGEKGILVVESNPGQASKRPCPEQVIAKAPETEHFVEFFVVHSEDNQRPAAKLSPFIVAKVLEHLIGHSYQAKKLHSGDLLVEVTTQKQSVAIQKMKSIVETSVTVTPHRTLNTVRGVISEEDLLDVSEDEILEGLRNSSVIAVKRIILRREGQEIPSKHLILSFVRHCLPATVKAGYLNCRVRPYVPNLQRCFRCQRFGHGSRSCRGREICTKCGSNEHVADVCESTVCCSNCKGTHAAYSRACPLGKQEKEILSLKAEENITYLEAKKRWSFLAEGSYADVARRGPAPRMESRATQVLLEDLAAALRTTKPTQGQQAPSLHGEGGACTLGARCLVSGVTTNPEPCGFAHPRLAVRGVPVSGEKGTLVVELSPGYVWTLRGPPGEAIHRFGLCFS
ncbi:hypothetical protein ISCGN_028395 [Ixodes scapularis]